jgi:hypothetical protein
MLITFEFLNTAKSDPPLCTLSQYKNLHETIVKQSGEPLDKSTAIAPPLSYVLQASKTTPSM